MHHPLHDMPLLCVAIMCGFIAQLVEHRTGIAEVMGSNSVEALIFFRLLSNCLNWKIYCNDHSSHSSITAVQINFAIIIIAACVAVPIVLYRAVPDQTVSRRVLSGADLGLWPLVPHLAKKHGVSN